MDPVKDQADSPSATEDVVDQATPVAEAAEPSSSSAEDVTPVESSTAEAEAKEPESLLDVVKRAVPEEDSKADEDEDAEAPEKTEAKGEAEDAEGKSDEPEVDDADLPFGKHPRFKQLLQERKQYLGELEQIRPQAEKFKVIDTFMRDNEIPPEDMAQAFQIMALLKTDPAKAREMLAPTIDFLEQYTGNRLPEDLQKKVDEGYIDAATAQEHARIRSQLALEQQRGQRAAQRVEEQSLQQKQVAIRDAVNTWERNLAERTPDYSKLQPFVAERVQVLLANSTVSDPEAAVKLAEQAYQEVVDRLRPFKQPRREVRPTRDVAGSVTPAAPKPRSFEEAIALAAAKQ